MRPTVAVLSTVHHADDTRIRERLIRSLAKDFHVEYRTRGPGPTDAVDLAWRELRGSRLSRLARSLYFLATATADVISIHDPELIPVAWIARVRGIPVVFDLHERFPDQLAEKDWMPWIARGLARFVAKGALKFANFAYTVTLAEKGYEALFSKGHPLFPNYPLVSGWPARVPPVKPSIVYVGEVTRQRGLDVAVEAAGLLGVPIRVVGPVTSSFRAELMELAVASGAQLELLGRLSNPEALKEVARASVAISPLRPIQNYQESLPTKVLEYVCVGVPVVASDLPGTREVLGSIKSSFLVEPESTAALVGGIRAAMEAASQKAAIDSSPHWREMFQWPDRAVRDFYLSLVLKSRERAS